jgi:hypothetical protein
MVGVCMISRYYQTRKEIGACDIVALLGDVSLW